MSLRIPEGETPATLRARGIRFGSVRRSVEWRNAQTPAERAAVFELRTRAYQKVGKYAADAAQPMRDEYDEDAVIPTAWHGERPVAAMRLMQHPEGRTWEHEHFVSLDHPALPPKQETIEITRVCVDPNWMGTDLVIALFQESAIEALRLGRRYMLGSATTSLLPLYTQIGCCVSPVQYRHEVVGGAEHTIFWADVAGGVAGGNVNWAVWALLWSEVYARARCEGLLPAPRPLRSVKLGLWRMTRPLVTAAFLLRRRLRKFRKRAGDRADSLPASAAHATQ